MTLDRPATRADDLLREHYERTVANFGAISSENLHFVGYFEAPDDSLVTALRQINRHLLHKLALRPQDRLLDVGCGTGGPACYLAEASGCRVVGVDLGEVQIAKAREQAQERGLSDRVTFRVEDATHLSLESGSFDAVLLMGSASHVPVKEALFAECARVLRPGGRLVLGDMVVVRPEWFADRSNSARVRIINLFFGNPHPGSRSGYEELLKGQGFHVAEVEVLTPHVRRSCELWRQTLEDSKDELIRTLDRGRLRALVSSIQSITDSVTAGAFDAVVITATRPDSAAAQ